MAPTGYLWWYIDAESDDGRFALSTIAFVGSVFSPGYARARAHGAADPRAFGAFNLALYGPQRAWAFSEMPLGDAQDPAHLQLGATSWQRVAHGIDITVEELSVPWRRPLRGVIRLRGTALGADAQQVLRAQGNHRWWPVMPHARIEVDFEQPKLRWQGRAYHDANWGDEPLAHGFARWDWMRKITAESTAVYFRLVDAARAGKPPAPARTLALEVSAHGEVRTAATPKVVPLTKSRWGVERYAFGATTRAETVEDTPFYARARLYTADEDATLMHESLDLVRWRRPWVQFLMGFRLRRLSSSR